MHVTITIAHCVAYYCHHRHHHPPSLSLFIMYNINIPSLLSSSVVNGFDVYYRVHRVKVKCACTSCRLPCTIPNEKACLSMKNSRVRILILGRARAALLQKGRWCLVLRLQTTANCNYPAASQLCFFCRLKLFAGSKCSPRPEGHNFTRNMTL